MGWLFGDDDEEEDKDVKKDTEKKYSLKELRELAKIFRATVPKKKKA